MKNFKVTHIQFFRKIFCCRIVKPYKIFIWCILGFYLFSCINGKERNITIQGSHINIGSRLELFVDNYIVEQLTGDADLKLHHPVPQEVAILHDDPWEGNNCHYHSIFKDRTLYKMYYRGVHIGTKEDIAACPHQQSFSYAESDDGTHWRKPNLGLYDFNGSKENNIILGFDCHSASMFKDINPAGSPDAKYKAFDLR
jgi:hypothetical protein